MNEYGLIHTPQAFTGYFYSKSHYVLRNASGGSMKINGGTLYAKGSSYFTNNTGSGSISIGSGVTKTV